MRIDFIEDVVDGGLYLSKSYKMGKNGYCGVSARNRGKNILSNKENFSAILYCMEYGYKYVQIKKGNYVVNHTKESVILNRYIFVIIKLYQSLLKGANLNKNTNKEINGLFIRLFDKVYEEELKEGFGNVIKDVYSWINHFGLNNDDRNDEKLNGKIDINIFKISDELATLYNKVNREFHLETVKKNKNLLKLNKLIKSYRESMQTKERATHKYIKTMKKFKEENKNELCPFLKIPADTIDHKMPLIKGGKTEYSNLLMMSDIENNLKAEYSFEEYKEITEKYFSQINKKYTQLYYEKEKVTKDIKEFRSKYLKLNTKKQKQFKRSLVILKQKLAKFDAEMEELIKYKQLTMKMIKKLNEEDL